MTYKRGWARYRVYYGNVEIARVTSRKAARRVLYRHMYRTSEEGWPNTEHVTRTKRRMEQHQRRLPGLGWWRWRERYRDGYYIAEDRNDGSRCDKQIKYKTRRCGRPVGHTGGCKSYEYFQNQNDRKKHRERVDELAKHLGYE